MTDKQNPLVSVVITTYYRNDYLRQAIESVEQQEYDNIETIVVDGSGECHARPAVSDYDVRYVAQEDDKGAQAARSIGAENAKGAFVNFLDDDDTLRPSKVEKQVSLLQLRSSVGVVYCGKTTEDGQRMMPRSDIRGDVLEYALKFEMTPSSPSTMLIRRSVLEQILPLRNRHGADDMGMKIELAQQTHFDFVDEALVVIGDSTNSLGESLSNVEGRQRILKEYDKLYEEHPSDVRRTAEAYTRLMKAEVILNRKYWSAVALKEALFAAYLIPGYETSFIGYLTSIVFGRPGREIGRHVYFRFFVGDTNRGKIT